MSIIAKSVSSALMCAVMLIWAGELSVEPWIHPKCCPDINCRVADHREVTATPQGYMVQGVHKVIRFDDARLFASHDAKYHLCSLEVPGVELQDDQDVIEVKCLYVPLGA